MFNHVGLLSKNVGKRAFYFLFSSVEFNYVCFERGGGTLKKCKEEKLRNKNDGCLKLGKTICVLSLNLGLR